MTSAIEPAARRPMSGRQLKNASVALILIGAGGFVMSLGGTWFAVGLRADVTVPVTGVQSAGAAQALALASLALAGALVLARGVLRAILAALGIVLGFATAALLVPVFGDPVQAAQARLGEATGVTGPALAAEISGFDIAPLAWIGLALAILGALGALLALLTNRSWPSGSNRYERRSTAARTQSPWDALSDGEDPTAGP